MTIREAAPIIKERVTSRQVVNLYGYTPNKGGYIKCPFHGDHDASLKVHRSGWYCYGCHQGGDAVEFIRLHEKCSFREAVAKADHYFSLDLLKPEKVDLDALERRRKDERFLRDAERVFNRAKTAITAVLEREWQSYWQAYREAWSKPPEARTAIDWWNMVVCKEAMQDIDDQINEVNAI